MKPRVVTLINYCSLDRRFIRHCIAGVAPFSQQVICTVFDRLFDGTAENALELQKTFRENPGCQFNFVPCQPDTQGPHYWHNLARWISFESITCDTDYVLFL